MKNRYKGVCSQCGKVVLPKQGCFRYRIFYKQSQDFDGLRCNICAQTTKRNLKKWKKMVGQKTLESSLQTNLEG